MDWALSPLSRLLTVLYLIIGVPIMFTYLRTTGSAAARGIRFLGRHLVCRMPNSTSQQHTKRNNSLSSASSVGSNNAAGNATSSANNSLSRRSSAAADQQRLKWQTRGSSQNQTDQQMMQLKPTHGGGGNDGLISSEAATLPNRPAVAVPIIGCAAMIALYLLVGAGFVARTTDVDYNDGFYFCFVALCTVGLGGSTVMRHASDGAIILVVIYVFVGITLLSTALHIVHYDVYVNLKAYRDLKMKKRIMAVSSKRSVGSLNKNSDVVSPS